MLYGWPAASAIRIASSAVSERLVELAELGQAQASAAAAIRRRCRSGRSVRDPAQSPRIDATVADGSRSGLRDSSPGRSRRQRRDSSVATTGSRRSPELVGDRAARAGRRSSASLVLARVDVAVAARHALTPAPAGVDRRARSASRLGLAQVLASARSDSPSGRAAVRSSSRRSIACSSVSRRRRADARAPRAPARTQRGRLAVRRARRAPSRRPARAYVDGLLPALGRAGRGGPAARRARPGGRRRAARWPRRSGRGASCGAPGAGCRTPPRGSGRA